LHALEKRPQDRPANAAEFRQELLTTAERLGLEHASITSSPNIEALRSVGMESPSGRLVIDISKLRESRAASSDATEVTVVSPSVMAAAGVVDSPAQSNNRSFSRLSVSFANRSTKQLMMIAVAVAVVLVLAFAIIAVRSRRSAPEAAAVASPSVTPTPEPSPSPVASPSPSPKREGRKPATTNNNTSKSNSVFKKFKKIFKSPF